MAIKLLMVFVGFIVVGGVLAAKVIACIFSERRPTHEDPSRWSKEGSSVAS